MAIFTGNRTIKLTQTMDYTIRLSVLIKMLVTIKLTVLVVFHY